MNHISSTGPTVELFTGTRELKEALQERIRTIFNEDVVDQFDVVRALGLNVTDTDLRSAGLGCVAG